MDQPPEQDSEGQGKPAARRSPKSVELPADLNVLRDARNLAGDKNVRISQLAETVSEDPVITLELLRVADATFFSGDRPAISTVQTAVIRLGSKLIVETLDVLKDRPSLADPEVFCEFEHLRSIGRQISVVSQKLAFISHRDIAEVAQTTGLMTYIGHMIACAYLGPAYVELSQNRARSAIAYRVHQDYHFDLNNLMLEYLRNHGVSNALFFGLDRELKCITPSQSALRFIVTSAVEMVEAFEAGRWEKYDPGKTLPSKSALRLLQLREEQYLAVHEEIDSYLCGKVAGSDGESADSEDSDQLPDDESIRRRLVASERKEGPTVVLRRSNFERPGGPKQASPTLILTRHGFGGYDPSVQPTNFIESNNEESLRETQSLSPDAQKVLDLIGTLCAESQTTGDLLQRLLSILITEAPFVRAALLVLKSHRQTADIHTAVGEGFEEEDMITVKDPLSPLALCLTQIKSFNASSSIEDLLAPFGISSYAVSPIRLKHEEPVVLYADCGINAPLPMEARKVFRLVVGLLSQTLPRLPGGLPDKPDKRLGALTPQ